MSAAAWLGLPLALYAIATGLGLLAERAARVRLPDGLLAPTGACLAILLVLPVAQLHGTATVSAVLLGGLALAGLLLAQRELPGRLAPGWAGAAALAAYALYLAPVVLSGHWTWLGYNFVNDTATNLALVDHVAEHGRMEPAAIESTRESLIQGALGTGYPLGATALLGALGRLVPVETAALYQPFIASFAALAAMALATLARRLELPGALAAGTGVVAAGAGLTYQYALHGAIKELGLVMVVATAAALARVALDERMRLGAVALLGVCLASGLGVFSAGAGAYAGGMALLLLAALAVERARPQPVALARAAGVGAAAVVLPVLPVLGDTLAFWRVGNEAFAAGSGGAAGAFDHLVRPLPVYQALGTWLRDDYRYPLEPGSAKLATTVLIVVAAALVVAVAVAEVRRRRFGALLAVGPALLVYLVAAPRLSPYADAKLLVVLSPALVFGAAVGAWWLARRSAAVGAAAGLLLALGVLGSDALAYHHARLAPVDRLEALRDAAEHAGGGEWLAPEWEEHAKHFAGDLALNAASERPSPRPAELLAGGPPPYNSSVDLDDLRLEYVLSWDGILLRRSPAASRPPASFSRVYGNRFYELWRREGGPEVLEHLRVQGQGEAAAVPPCADVRALAARAQPGERLVAAPRSPLPGLDPTRPPARPPHWGDGPSPDVVVPAGQARVSGSVTVPGGRSRVWVRGGGGRAVHASVDGREVGARQDVNTPGQWLELGEVELAAGPHDVALVWPGGSLAPGNGHPGVLGRLVLEPVARSDLVSLPPERARELCGRSWDWIERVSG